MRFLSTFLILINSLLADVVLKDINTSLYSKSAGESLKDISISLDFEGVDLDEAKLLDATNSVISSFFYEDLFTEIGKNHFKKTLQKVLEKNYDTRVDAIYILKLSKAYKYDIKELKEFLLKELKKEKAPAITEPKVNEPKINKPDLQIKEQKPLLLLESEENPTPLDTNQSNSLDSNEKKLKDLGENLIRKNLEKIKNNMGVDLLF